MICPQACVMFAAIPNFKAFFSTVDVSGKECLRLLNEIMISFDKVSFLVNVSKCLPFHILLRQIPWKRSVVVHDENGMN